MSEAPLSRGPKSGWTWSGEHRIPSLVGLRRLDRISSQLLVVLLPLIAALIVTGVWHSRQRFRDARAAVTAQNAAIVAEVTARLQIRTNEARALLTGLAGALSMDPAHVERNEALLRDVLARAPRGFNDLWISDASGVIVARASTTSARGIVVADRPYFQASMASGQFHISEPLLGRSTRQWGVVFAMPILRDDARRPLGVVSVSMRANSFAELLRAELPAGSYVTLIDSAGRIVYRTLEPERYVGTTIPNGDSLLFRVQREGEVTSDRRSVVDGIRRMSTHRRVDGTRWQLSVGVPTRAAMAFARREQIIESAILALTVLLAVWLAWIFARRVSAPLEALTHDVLSRAAGQRAPRHFTMRGEVGILAAAFDHLVSQIDVREHALADTARRYEQLFDATPLPIIEWDIRERTVVAANAAALRFYGLERESAAGTRVDALFDVRELASFPVNGSELVDGVSLVFPSMAHRRVGGVALEVDSYATVVRSPRGLVVMHATLDLSARRATERALEESREQLRQAQKLESLGAFAGGIAHDFNNHLAAVLGFCELAQLRNDLSNETADDLNDISRAAQRASDLTRQLLIFAKRQPIALRPLDAGTVIEELTPSLQRLMGPTHQLQIVVPPSRPFVRGDRVQLEQIVMNLVTNARDAMPDGGELIVDLSTDGDHVVLSVRDTGVGMPPDVAARVFEPFFTTKSRSKGSGLGLSIVYGIVQRMQGELHVESDVGRGTTFSITLPIDRTGALERSAAIGETDRAIAPLRATVLLVDDDPAVRQMTRAMLEHLECRVTAASSGAEALDLAARMGGAFDLLLTDMVMPGMGGRALSTAIRESYPTVRVVYMSGYTEDAQFQAGRAQDAHEFVAKPFTLHELAHRIRAVLDGSPSPLSRAA
jgi:two-component system, cell cycle sensor histidine kinase and response regulator CckA